MPCLWDVPVALVVLLSICNAGGQELGGRYRPEKATYLVGEPVFIVLELTNISSRRVDADDGTCFHSFDVVVPAEPRRAVSLYGCNAGGTAGSCGSGTVSLKPKETITRRYLLPKSLPDEPGDYEVNASTTVSIYAVGSSERVSRQDVNSSLTLHIIPGSREALVNVYQPILNDLASSDASQKFLAMEAVTDYPQPFLEDVILKMSENPQTTQNAISGLMKLNTGQTKKRLAELVASDNEGIRQNAVTALAETDDPNYCGLMLQVMNARRGYSSTIAARGAGLLCGDKALPQLIRGLQGTDALPAYEIAYALGNTASRDAVPILIDLLRQPNAGTRDAAEEALATLTHRADEPVGTDQAYSKWSRYWSLYGNSAQLFRPDQCGGEFQSLPD
jgi:hypothetical protein